MLDAVLFQVVEELGLTFVGVDTGIFQLIALLVEEQNSGGAGQVVALQQGVVLRVVGEVDLQPDMLA